MIRTSGSSQSKTTWKTSVQPTDAAKQHQKTAQSLEGAPVSATSSEPPTSEGVFTKSLTQADAQKLDKQTENPFEDNELNPVESAPAKQETPEPLRQEQEILLKKFIEIPQRAQVAPMPDSFISSKRHSRLFGGLMVIFLVGMLYGSVLANTNQASLLTALSGVTQSALSASNDAFLPYFTLSVLTSSVFLCTIFLGGFCMIGQPFVGVCLFIRGLGIGSYMGLLYLNYGLSGVLYSTCVVLPGVLLSTFLLVIAAKQSIRLSNRTLRYVLQQQHKPQAKQLSTYVKQFLGIFLALCVAGVLDGWLRSLIANRIIL